MRTAALIMLAALPLVAQPVMPAAPVVEPVTFTLSWKPCVSPGVTNYVIGSCLFVNSSNPVVIGPFTNSTWTNIVLTESAPAYYAVKAESAAGQSEWAMATPAPYPPPLKPATNIVTLSSTLSVWPPVVWTNPPDTKFFKVARLSTTKRRVQWSTNIFGQWNTFTNWSTAYTTNPIGLKIDGRVE